MMIDQIEKRRLKGRLLLILSLLLVAVLMVTACAAQETDTVIEEPPAAAVEDATIVAEPAVEGETATEEPVTGGEMATEEPVAEDETVIEEEPVAEEETTIDEEPIVEEETVTEEEPVVGAEPTEAADAVAEDTTDTIVPEAMSEAGLRTSELIGYNVINSQGEDLGEIEDFLVGLDSEQVRYAVLSFGGFLDIGDKLFAIPVTAMSLDTNQQALVFDVDEATLENAPNFDDNTWPDLNNPQWDLDTRSYWENEGLTTTNQAQEAAMTEAEAVVANEAMVRASELLDYDVINSQGEDIGDIEDLTIGLDSGRIRYALLSFGGFLDIGDKLFVIPLSSLTLDAEQDAVIFDVDQATLENAPGFDPNNWPDMANPQWDLDSRDYWENR